jgi:hypothetical protein
MLYKYKKIAIYQLYYFYLELSLLFDNMTCYAYFLPNCIAIQKIV